MKLLVVGGAGYVGSHCVKRLVASGHAVTVFDNLSAGHRAAVDPRANFVEGDLGDPATLDGLFEGGRYDAVMHFAALLDVNESVREPLKYWRNNVTNTLHLLECMRAHGVRRFVFSSTCAVYGEPEDLPVTEDLAKTPISPYGCTKLSVEWMLQNSALAWGLGSVSLRYFNACGAAADGTLGEDHDPEIHLIPVVLQVALGKRRNIEVFGTDYPTPDGSCIRDYIHVDDLAEAHRLAVEECRLGRAEAYNVGTGRGHSVLEIIATAREVTGHAIPAVVTERRQGDPPALFADPGKLRARFEWEPRYGDVRKAIETAWRWHRNHPHGYADKKSV